MKDGLSSELSGVLDPAVMYWFLTTGYRDGSGSRAENYRTGVVTLSHGTELTASDLGSRHWVGLRIRPEIRPCIVLRVVVHFLVE